MPENYIILVAEDDANDVFFLRRAFEKVGQDCRVFDVSDGEQVISYLTGATPFQNRAQYPLPDLLLLDLKMPLKSGFEVLGWLQTHPGLCSVPALVLSSSEHEKDILLARSLGAREFHVKPSTLNQLEELAADLRARWLVRKASALGSACPPK